MIEKLAQVINNLIESRDLTVIDDYYEYIYEDKNRIELFRSPHERVLEEENIETKTVMEEIIEKLMALPDKNQLRLSL